MYMYVYVYTQVQTIMIFTFIIIMVCIGFSLHFCYQQQAQHDTAGTGSRAGCVCGVHPASPHGGRPMVSSAARRVLAMGSCTAVGLHYALCLICTFGCFAYT